MNAHVPTSCVPGAVPRNVRLVLTAILWAGLTGLTVLGGCRKDESPATSASEPASRPAPGSSDKPAPSAASEAATPAAAGDDGVAAADDDSPPAVSGKAAVEEGAEAGTETGEPEEASEAGAAAEDPDVPVVVVDRLRTIDAHRMTVSRGARFAVAEVGENVVQVFDASRGRLIVERVLSVPTEHGPRAARLCIGTAVSPDGRSVLVRGDDRVVALDLATGRLLREYAKGKSNAPRCAWAGDGLRLITGDPKEVRVHTRSGTVARTVGFDRLDRVHQVGTDRAGMTLLATGRKSGRSKALVHGGEGGDIWRELESYDGSGPLTMTDSGRWIAGPSAGGETRIWDAFSGKVVHRVPRSRPLRFLERDTRLALAEPTALVTLDTKDWAEQKRLNLTMDVLAADLADDGRRLLVAGALDDDQLLSHWNLGDREPRFQRQEPVHGITGIGWTNDALHVVTPRGSVAVNATTGAAVATAKKRPEEVRRFLDGVAWSGGRWPRFFDRDIALIEDASGEVAWSRRLAQPVVGFAMTGDGARVVSLLTDGTLDWRQAADGLSVEAPYPEGTEVPALRAMTTLSTGREVLGATTAGFVRIGDTVRTVPAELPKVRLLAVNQARSHVAVAGRTVVSVHTLDGGSPCRWLAPFVVRDLALSADGNRVVLSDGVDVTVWTRCGEPRARVHVLTAPELGAVVVGPDDERFTMSSDLMPVRWRRGLIRMTGREPELPQLVRSRRGQVAL